MLIKYVTCIIYQIHFVTGSTGEVELLHEEHFHIFSVAREGKNKESVNNKPFEWRFETSTCSCKIRINSSPIQNQSLSLRLLKWQASSNKLAKTAF